MSNAGVGAWSAATCAIIYPVFGGPHSFHWKFVTICLFFKPAVMKQGDQSLWIHLGLWYHQVMVLRVCNKFVAWIPAACEKHVHVITSTAHLSLVTLQEQSEYKAMNLDQWTAFLRLCDEVIILNLVSPVYNPLYIVETYKYMDGWQHDYGKTTSINYFELQVTTVLCQVPNLAVCCINGGWIWGKLYLGRLFLWICYIFFDLLWASSYFLIANSSWNLLQLKPDFSNYDENQAWPLLLDNFVEWAKMRMQNPSYTWCKQGLNTTL